MKRRMLYGAILFMMVLSIWNVSKTCQASSGVVQLSCDVDQVEQGKKFTVICQVSSDENIQDVELKVQYDSTLVTFIKGGSKVSGGSGELLISSKGNTDQVNMRTYSLQFRALESGNVPFSIGDGAIVTNSQGASISLSSNMISVPIQEKKNALANTARGKNQNEETETVAETPAPTQTPVYSKNNKLKALSFHCLSMSPAFEPEVLDYTIQVDCNTQMLYLNFVPASSKSKVRVKNNEELLPGENFVKIVVTAESGDKRTYDIRVLKESESETKVRQQEEMGSSDITFSIYEKDGGIFIQNQYQFQVVNVEDEDIIPSGYVKSSVDIEGKTVTAYTMENDLDNNYLLMYLKGVSSEPTLYQYDRQEKTLQRYTGTMVQKVNQGGNVAMEEKEFSNMGFYTAIVAMAILILVLLIVIMNLVLKQKIGKGKRELDDLDF